MAIYTISNYLRLNVWETANTQSYVTLSMTLEKNDAHPVRNVSGTLRLAGRSVQINITDANYNGSGTVLYTISGVSPSYGGNNTVTSTVSFIGTYEVYNTPTVNQWNSMSANFTDYYTATRPVSAAITTSANSVQLGNSITITTSGGTSGNMTFKVGSTTVETKTNIGNTTTTFSPTLANYASLNPNGASMTCVITWNNITKNVTLTIPQNSSTKPTATVAMSIDSGGLSGLYVQSKSKAKATVDTTTKYGAKITSCSVTMNGSTIAASATSTTNVTWIAISGLLTASGSNTCSVTVTDSRGFTNTASTTFTVQAYSSPTLSAVSIFRSNSSGTAATEGTYLRFNFTPTISPIQSNNVNNNAKTYKLSYKLASASGWAETSGTLTSYTAATGFTIGNNLISTSSLYDAQLSISDSYETVYSAVFSIPTATVIMDFNSAGTGGGIGMYTQAANQLDIAWDTHVHGRFKAPDGLFLQDLESKNLFQNPAVTQTVNGVTFTINSDKSVSMSGTAAVTFGFTLGTVTLAAGTYILSGATGGSSAAYLNLQTVTNDVGSGSTFTLSSSGTYNVNIGITSGTNVTGKRFYPMIRKASVTDSAYAPGVSTAAEDAKRGLSGFRGQLSSGANLDNFKNMSDTGMYTLGSGVTNAPRDWCALLVISTGGATHQLAFAENKIYVRSYTGSPLAWTVWRNVTLGT